MASIDIPYAIGSAVWFADRVHAEERVTCEECGGTKSVRLTRHGGETFEIDCEACGLGYEGPRGWVLSASTAFVPSQVVLHRFLEFRDGEAQYADTPQGTNAYRVLGSKYLFADRESCEAKCAELRAEHLRECEERNLRNLMSKRRKLAWSVHYWRSERRRRVEEIERIDARLRACKERGKEGAE